MADHGEVFTNPREVNAMLDLVHGESFWLDSRFLEPACGDGNYLIEILRHKLFLLQDIKSQTGRMSLPNSDLRSPLNLT